MLFLFENELELVYIYNDFGTWLWFGVINLFLLYFVSLKLAVFEFPALLLAVVWGVATNEFLNVKCALFAGLWNSMWSSLETLEYCVLCLTDMGIEILPGGIG